MGTGGRARERAGVLLNGDRVSVFRAESILEMDGGDGCPTMWTHFMPPNCALIKMESFMLCVFTTIKHNF